MSYGPPDGAGKVVAAYLPHPPVMGHYPGKLTVSRPTTNAGP